VQRLDVGKLARVRDSLRRQHPTLKNPDEIAAHSVPWVTIEFKHSPPEVDPDKSFSFTQAAGCTLNGRILVFGGIGPAVDVQRVKIFSIEDANFSVVKKRPDGTLITAD